MKASTDQLIDELTHIANRIAGERNHYKRIAERLADGRPVTAHRIDAETYRCNCPQCHAS